jgi:hypothetical protein
MRSELLLRHLITRNGGFTRDILSLASRERNGLPLLNPLEKLMYFVARYGYHDHLAAGGGFSISQLFH